MGSVMLALLVLAVGAGLLWLQDKPGTAVTPVGQRSHRDLGVTMQYDAPCPRCDGTPVEILEMVDGRAWICPHCGHQETEGAADIDAYVEQLGGHDPETVAAWRKALGLKSRSS